MGQTLPTSEDIHQEAYDTIVGQYGHIDVASLTYSELARLCVYVMCIDDPQVRERDRTCPRQKGSIEELFFLRDMPHPISKGLVNVDSFRNTT